MGSIGSFCWRIRPTEKWFLVHPISSAGGIFILNSPNYHLHKNLVSKILKSKYPLLHRNYTAWLKLRTLLEYGGNFNISDLNLILQDLFGITYNQAKNMINHGQGFFWEIHWTQVRLMGKQRVFVRFGVQNNPGKVSLVPHEELFGVRLQYLRSILWQISTGGTMQAKSTMEKNLKRVPQTFRNYQKFCIRKPIRNFTEEEYINPETGELYHKQLPNFYLEPFFTKTLNLDNKKYDWNDTVGLDPKEESVAVYHPRYYFNTENQFKDYERKGYVDESKSSYVFSERKVFNRKYGGVNLWKSMN